MKPKGTLVLQDTTHSVYLTDDNMLSVWYDGNPNGDQYRTDGVNASDTALNTFGRNHRGNCSWMLALAHGNLIIGNDGCLYLA